MGTQALTVRTEQGLAPVSQKLTDLQRLGSILSASGYFSDAREMAQAAVKVMAGEELGIPPVAAMMGINIIKGKVALSGNLIASRIRAHGYDYRHKHFDNKGCCLEFLGQMDVHGKRAVLGESSFTEEDAKAAGVFSDMYKKYPRNMYFARAISNGARWYCPEIFAGAPVYAPEELGARVDENGEVIHDEPKPSRQAAQDVAQEKIRQMKAGKSYAEASAPAPPQPEPDEQAATSIKARLEQFARMKEGIGQAAYYAILERHGHAHANEIKSLNAARAVYKEMAAFAKQQPPAEQTQPAYEGTDADLPAEMLPGGLENTPYSEGM